MRILITGGNGQLGRELAKIIETMQAEIGRIPEVYQGCEVISTDSDILDITNEKQVMEFIEGNRPDIVINCAAYTNVDRCEQERELANSINADGPLYLGKACDRVGAKLVHVSTDYVFSGVGSVPFKTNDAINPQSVYGLTKAQGERNVMENCTKYFIVRTAWLYGYEGNNFVKTIRRLAGENEKIKVVNDQVGNPTHANDLAYHLLKLAVTEKYGIYHCTNEKECSWFDFAKKIVEFSHLNCLVEPCTSEQFPRPAKRPAYSSLDKSELDQAVGNQMRDWEVALKCYIMNLDKGEK